jgi:predicted RND superfamily exporter protein
VGAVVDASGRHPWLVLLVALGVAAVAWHFALEVLRHPRTDLRELLPTDSPGLKAFEHQLGRVGGGGTLIVIVESPDRAENERFIDTLADRIEAQVVAKGSTLAPLVAHVERGTKDVHRFFEQEKWLYADLRDLDDAYERLDAEIALRGGLVSDLGDQGPARLPTGAAGSSAGQSSALGLDRCEARWRAREAELDAFPGGYFEDPGGRMVGLRVVSRTTGLGDAAGDALLEAVGRLVGETKAAMGAPALQVGFAGDVANAVAEKDSVVGQAAWAGVAAFVLIAGGIVWFYRSAWAPLIIATPAVIGVGIAYAFAYFRFGYVNTTGMFLGAIILGNGINYPIVLLSRYREFVSRGRPRADARREAVQNALRAELVGASVTSIAYGSLTVTQFRGFTQFGWIGFVGMLFVWIVMIPCVPALLVVVEGRGPERLVPGERAGGGPVPGGVVAAVARWAERHPGVVLLFGALVTGCAATRIPSFLRDPWEYNFEHLGSRGSKRGGAGEWSNKAEVVFGGKANVAGALMLADEAMQVPEVRRRILEMDGRDPAGPLIAGITTVDDFLPGPADEQLRKLEVLSRIRDRLTPAVLDSLGAGERARVAALRPPEALRVLGPGDLPPLLRRRFEETDGRVGTVFYVRFRGDVSLSDGHNLLRIARATDHVALADGTVVQTASRSTIFSEMIRSMERDGPRATLASFLGVALVVLVATRNPRGAGVVLAALAMAVVCMLGGAAALGEKYNYVNFITLPITFGIGCEYPFNVYDRSRLLGGDVSGALERVGGAVALCSYTTVVGYGSLVFADFQALQSFGRLAVAGELACVTAALAIVPALLRLGPRQLGQ